MFLKKKRKKTHVATKEMDRKNEPKNMKLIDFLIVEQIVWPENLSDI